MRIAVVGAGAVGGTIAVLFDRAGHEVEITARGEHADSIARDGLRLSGTWGDHLARVPVGAELKRRPELAFVTTKAHAADSAMRPAARMLDGIPVVVVQNGLQSVTTARDALPTSPVIGALALFAASFLSPGRISVTASGPIHLDRGTVDTMPSLFAERALDGVLPVRVVNNFVGAQWTKLVINQVNAFPAITGLSVQEVVADPALRSALTRSMREAVKVGLASGVRFEPLQGMTHGLLTTFARAPESIAQFLPHLIARRMGAVPNPGSTLQSIRRGQLTEVDHLNGAVVRAAEEIGLGAPVNVRLVQLVHDVEQSQRFLRSPELSAALSR